MKNMEEIVYWVQTKRPPCLYKLDSLNKKQNSGECSRNKIVEINSLNKGTPNVSPKKKKKRKLSILDDSTSEQEQNVFFESTPRLQQQQTILSSCKDSIISETELNVKQSVAKRNRISKMNIRNITSQGNNLMTSTPKPAPNSRKHVKRFEKTRLLDSSLESGLFSGETKNKQSSLSKTVSKKSMEKFATGDYSNIQPKNNSYKINNKHNDNALNGLFDDVSDVSGFTANYIRSTKQGSNSKNLNQTKRTNKQLIKESQDSNTEQKDDNKVILCVNKSVNTTGNPRHGLNCSTDSCNIFNFVSVDKSNKTKNSRTKIDKSTSILKFIEPSTKVADKVNNHKLVSKNSSSKKGLDTSFQSRSSATSRYFTRSKMSSLEDMSMFRCDATSTPVKKSTRARAPAGLSNNNNMDQSDGGNKSCATKAKRKMTVSKSVLVIDSSEPQSSVATVNVAANKNKRTTSTVKRVLHKSDKKDKGMSSTRGKERSVFAACFSDSEEEQKPATKKFFA